MRSKISCTIIAKNEADRISACLRSVQAIADEIIVVDSGSSDQTVEVSQSFGAKCYHNEWQGFGFQKRFAEDKATNDWILNLDADEWLTEELRREILSLQLQDEPKVIFGYRLKIKNVYPITETPRLFADQHKYIRLYHKKRCRFPESAVFDEIKLARKHYVTLKYPVFHQSIRSISHLIRKNIDYYQLQGAEKRKRKAVTLFRLLCEPPLAFVKYYICRRHFTGGCYGFLVASTIACLRTYRLMIIAFPRKTN